MIKRLILLAVIVKVITGSGELKKYVQVSEERNKGEFKVLKIER